jgi:hypothetical protein
MPTVRVTPSATNITTAQNLSVTVALSGGSGNPTPTGSFTLTGGGYTSPATTLTAGSATINILAGLLATGSDTLTATYTPDSSSSSTYNSAAGSATVTVTQAPTPTFSLTNTSNITVTAGDSTGNTTTTTATPSNGFIGAITLACAITASPANAVHPVTCSLPSPVTIAGATAATATLTVNSTAATSSALESPFRFLAPSGGVALAILYFLGVLARRRSWRGFLAGLVILFAVAAVGCGGGGSSNSPPPSGGTTPGAYTATVTGTSGNLTQTTAVTVKVN